MINQKKNKKKKKKKKKDMAKNRDKDLKITDEYININTEKKEDNNEHTQIKYNIDESELEIINKENENFSEKEENLESSDSENYNKESDIE